MQKYDCITARRGKGLMQGLVISNGVKVGDITKEALNHGLIVISAGSDVLSYGSTADYRKTTCR